MESGDELYPPSFVMPAEQILMDMVTRLQALAHSSVENAKPLVRHAVLQLNTLNEKHGYGLIETGEREELVLYINDALNKIGVRPDEDITLEWRDW